uniref:Coiled-coil domain containing 106b n=1 Tax=Astyanax mexicanus TaxID=7994 RepID=A0A3B1IXX1_ASTMX
MYIHIMMFNLLCYACFIAMPNIRKTKRSTRGSVVVHSEGTVVTPAAAPTAQLSIDKLCEETKRLNEETRFLKEENRLLKEENRLLKEEKDFLREQLGKKETGSTSKSAKGSKKIRKNYSSDSSSSSESWSHSDSESEQEKRKKHKKAAAFGKRVKCPEDVLHRYKAVLKEFQRTRSVTVSCEKLNVDRNTIALTVIIAEVTIAAQGQDIGLVPEFREDETLNHFAQRCKAFLDENEELRDKIKELKKRSELIPIKQKFRR